MKGVLNMPVQVSELWKHIEEIAREKHGVRAYIVLQGAGVSATTVRLLRLGRLPKTATSREKIAEALGVPVDELFGTHAVAQAPHGEGSAECMASQ
jgi:transcriptional regulator with XRE-family HTH domain